MPKIQRKTQKIFCGNADNDQLAVFGSMATGTPVYTNDIEQLQNNVAYLQGWEAATLEDKAPFMEEMNGLQYGLSKQIAYTLQEGIPEYDANTTYYIGSIVKLISEGKPKLYSSLVDNNIGNSLSDESFWEELFFGGGDINDKITNCILAMYGITYSGNTFTVKAGTKALAPNGFNVDGTYNNIEWVAQSDIVQSVAFYGDSTHLIYLPNTNQLLHSHFLGSFAQAPEIGGANGTYYNTTENIFYLNGTTQWYPSNIVFLAELTATDGTITTFEPKKPVRLVTYDDIKDNVYITETYRNGTSWYNIYSNGWCEQGGLMTATNDGYNTVTLLQEYINTDFSIMTTSTKAYTSGSNTSHAAAAAYGAIVRNPTTSSFEVYCQSSSQKAYWETKGNIR